jgi:OPA family sugar phosphate sensor protein UhpC-like MFS transporter
MHASLGVKTKRDILKSGDYMLKAVFDLFRPAAIVPEIKDPALVEKTYKYWRMRTFYSMYIGYLCYYFTRKSFSVITPFLIVDLGLTKSDIGWLASILSVSYGASKFISGILSDRSNPRYFMAVGLMLTGVCNIFFGFFSSVYLLGLFWGLNGFFQGWGWPACTKQLSHWFSRSERGTWWSACTTSQNVGGFLIVFVAGYCAEWYGWRFGMYVPGIVCIAVGLWLLNRLRDVPQSLGLPEVEKYKNEPATNKEGDTQELLPVKQILFNHVLNNKYVWILAVSYFFVYVVRTAIHDWGPVFLTEMKGYTPVTAVVCMSWFEVGGFFGMLVAGWGSDYWFEGKRVPLMVVGALGLVVTTMGFWYLVPHQTYMASTLFGIIGFLVFGPQMLVGLAAAEFVSKKAASTSNGFAGYFAYLGAAAAGYPLMKVTEIWGWYGFIVTLVICSAAVAVVLMPIWSAKSGAVDEKVIKDPSGEIQASVETETATH